MNAEPAKPNAAFAYVTMLFFAWGFVTATIDPLVPAVRSIFSLGYAESLLTQFAFFLAYGIVSLPAAGIVGRLGAARSVIAALLVMVAGCLLMPVATLVRAYPLVLLALFVIASGITLLQVAANPLSAALGRPERSHFRLTLSQAFNSLGTVLAPYIGAQIMLSGGVFAGPARGEADIAASLRAIDTAFLLIAGVILVLAWFLFRVRHRITAAAPAIAGGGASVAGAFRSRWAVAGALAIFLYVGAEVSIGSVMINFLEQPGVLGVPAQRAGELLALYWGGAMIGRFAGSALLARLPAGALLATAAAVAAALCLLVSQSAGTVAGVAALSIGLFNSIMFPTIFTLTLERSSASTPATSGLLCMAIVGGAVLPLLVGTVADRAGLAPAFLVPALAYLLIAGFGVAAARVRVRRPDAVPIAAH